MAKQRKKSWYKVIAPKILGEVEVGEVLAFEPKDLSGKTLTLNLMTVTNNPRNRDYNACFEIVNYEDEKAKTRIVGINMQAFAIKKIVRKGRDKLDDSFVLTTKDGIKLRVKPVIITKNNSSNERKTFLRKLTRLFLLDNLSPMELENVFVKIIDNSLNKDLANFLNQHHPVSRVEIRSISIEKSVKAKTLRKEDIKLELPETQLDNKEEINK